DYNRYIRYGWNDRSAEPAQAFSPSHRGFMFTGALLVRRWAAAHARTAEPPFLDWANRMTAKWHALQHPQTGLMPHFFGAINPGDTEQSATPYAEISDVNSAIEFLEAARVLNTLDSPPARDLAQRLHTMGLNLMRGILTHGYDSDRKLFPQ